MKCLIVISHPLPDSLCLHLAEHISRELDDAGHDVTVENLYESGFNPLLNTRERESYYSDQYETTGLDSHIRKLIEAEALILIFPTWWFSFPAVLKGWFDRVWGPGIAYDHTENFGPINPRLENLKHVLAVTTLGSPWWVDRLILRQPVKRVLKLALLGGCARQSKLTFKSFYKAESADTERVNRFKRAITAVLQKWPKP